MVGYQMVFAWGTAGFLPIVIATVLIKPKTRSAISLKSFTNVSTQLNRNIRISWSLNIAIVVAAAVLLVVVPLDVVQTTFCAHTIVFCITCAVLVWTKSSWHIFCLSVGVPVTFFVGLAHLIWNCEPLFFVCKVVAVSLLVFCTRFMRIGGSRLLHVLAETPKIRVRVTKVQTLIGASLVLAASLHLAFLNYGAVFSFVEIVLWGCFFVDVLWHFGVWKTDMRRAFRKRICPLPGTSSLIIVNDIKKRQMVSTIVGVLVAETLLCVYMVLANAVFGLQEESNECKRRSTIGSNRLALILFPTVLAAHIAIWMLIYAHVTTKRRDMTLRDTKREHHPSLQLQVSSLIFQVDSTCS